MNTYTLVIAKYDSDFGITENEYSFDTYEQAINKVKEFRGGLFELDCDSYAISYDFRINGRLV
jgi:hypothetical protein